MDRLVVDTAKEGTKAAIWRCLEIAAEALAPGLGGSAVKATHLAIRVLNTAESLNEGRGLDFKIPIWVEPTTGIYFGTRTRLLEDNPQPTSPVHLDLGWNPVQPPTAGRLNVEAASERGVIVTASRAEIRTATDSEIVDADALRRYVNRSGQRPPTPYAITYIDHDVSLGLVAIVTAEGRPYCPMMFEVDSRPEASEPFRMWRAPEKWSPTPSETQATKKVRGSSRRGWSQVRDELVDRFAGPESLLITTAIASNVAGRVINPAFGSFGQNAAEPLQQLGALGPAFLAGAVARRTARTADPLAVRYVLQEIVRWSLISDSPEAADCRHHLANLLANRTLLRELIRDLQREQDGLLLEYAIEGLESLAADSAKLYETLARVFKDIVNDC